MNLTRYEMETIINYNDESGEADVFTASKATMRNMDKLCEKHPDTYRCYERTMSTASYKCPKNRIRFAAPASERRRAANRALALQHGFKTVQLGAEIEQERSDHT